MIINKIRRFDFSKYLKQKDNNTYKFFIHEYEKVVTSLTCYSVQKLNKLVNHLLVIKGINSKNEILKNDLIKALDKFDQNSIDEMTEDMLIKKAFWTVKEQMPNMSSEEFMKMTDISKLSSPDQLESEEQKLSEKGKIIKVSRV